MTPAHVGRAGLLGLVVLLALVLLGATACSSSGSGSGRTGSPLSPFTVSTPTPVSSRVSTSTTEPTPTTTAPASSAAPSSTTPVPSSTSSAPSPSTCRTVTVRVLPGGAEPGAEIAALQFTNAGTRRCALGGFPTVSLLLKGRPVGSASQPGTRPAKTITLAPGDTVESLLTDLSGCQAPLSDSARVSVPGESTSVVRPISLRACTLRVAPLGPPS